jgi:2-polyprenyl-3-methyl-5-hydroxy-6-metoxy-1,4-benzoquinol methylase
MVPNELIEKMRRDWDGRAVENHRYFIVNSRIDWSDGEFWKSGENSVSQYVLNDMGNVCRGRRPADMRVLDFGCGAGRVTRALAKVFGEVHGVDISGEMVGLARQALADVLNVEIHHSSGKDLDVLGRAFLTSPLRSLFSIIFLASPLFHRVLLKSESIFTQVICSNLRSRVF